MRIRNPVIACGAGVALLIGPLAGVSLAHVEVTSTPDATQGGSAALTFEVTSEKESPTIAVEVALPTNTPILGITVPPIEGWTLSLATTAAPAGLIGPDGQSVTDVVSSVEWTAIGVGIAPRESADFVIGAGMLPAADRISLPVTQTYSDGSVVSWAQEAVDGASEPDFPAPVLFLTPGVQPGPGPGPSVIGSKTPAVHSSQSDSPLSTNVPLVASPARSVVSGSATSAPNVAAITGAPPPGTQSSNTTPIVVVAVIVAVLLGYAVVRHRRKPER